MIDEGMWNRLLEQKTELLDEVKLLRKKNESLFATLSDEGRIIDEWCAVVQRLKKELKEAEDVIQYALDRAGVDDDAKRVFEDYLEVIE